VELITAWSDNPEIRTWAEIKSLMFNQLSHPGAPTYKHFNTSLYLLKDFWLQFSKSFHMLRNHIHKICSFVTQNVVRGPAAWAPSENLLERHISGSNPNLLNDNLHLNNTNTWFHMYSKIWKGLLSRSSDLKDPRKISLRVSFKSMYKPNMFCKKEKKKNEMVNM